MEIKNVTMWPEITETIRFEEGQKSTDRSDIVARVFHMKLEEYLADIKEGHIFGPVHAASPHLWGKA